MNFVKSQLFDVIPYGVNDFQPKIMKVLINLRIIISDVIVD